MKHFIKDVHYMYKTRARLKMWAHKNQIQLQCFDETEMTTTKTDSKHGSGCGGQFQCSNCVVKMEDRVKEELTTFRLLTDASDDVSKHSPLWWVAALQNVVCSQLERHRKGVTGTLVAAFIVAYAVYLGYVFTRTSGGWATLIVLTVICACLFVYEMLKAKCGRTVGRLVLTPLIGVVNRIWTVGKWLWWPCFLMALCLYLSISVVSTWTQGLALLGYCVFISLTLVTSTNVTQICWRPVVAGLTLQVALVVIFLRVGAAYRAAHWVSEQVTGFLRHSLRGSTTAFGNPTAFFHPLLMVVCPVIIYVGATMAFLSHTGITGYLTAKLSWLIKVTFGISHIESKVMAESVLSGMMDHAMTFRSYMRRVTPSEMVTTLVTAHSNLSSFMYSLFSVFWVVPDTLFLGAFFAAPAGIALSKISKPEVHQTYFTNVKDTADERDDKNIAERTAIGAWQAGKVVIAIVVQVIAFLSMYELFDVILSWIGKHANIELDFKVVFSHVFLPFAYLLGVPWSEVKTCAYVLGLSLTQNEILAYLELGAQRMAGTMTKKAAAITTAAVCGYSSFASMTLVVGGWYSAAPATYRRAVSSLWRVYLITKMASFSTACLFGVFYDEALIEGFEKDLELSTGWLDIGRMLSVLPSYKVLLRWLGLDI